MRSKKQDNERRGKANKKVEIKAKVEQQMIQQAAEEEKKAAQNEKFNKKINKQLQAVNYRDREAEVVVEQVDKEALNAPYPEVEYRMNGYLIEASEEEKQNLNLVIIGHVDSGKSTLSG